MPKKTAPIAAPPPGQDPEFDAAWEKIESTLAAAGEMLTVTEAQRRRELTAMALARFSGKTYTAEPYSYQSGSVEVGPDDPPPPEVLVIPPAPVALYWYDDPKDAATLDHYILARRQLGNAMSGALLITGEAGFGKTMGVRKSIERLNRRHNGEECSNKCAPMCDHLSCSRCVARKKGQPDEFRLFVMNCATVTDPGKWFGRREADKEGTHFIKSDLAEAVETGAVILLDDVGRLHPHIHNAVMSWLDGSESVVLSDLNAILYRHPQTVFVATTNEGTQYGGNHRMDWAMRERFSTTLRRQPPPAEEEIRILTTATACPEDAAGRLVQIARSSRDLRERGELRNAISTRTLVAAAMWVGFGKSEWDALDITAVQEFDGDASGMTGAESDRQKVLVIMIGTLGKNPNARR